MEESEGTPERMEEEIRSNSGGIGYRPPMQQSTLCKSRAFKADDKYGEQTASGEGEADGAGSEGP